MTFGRDGAEGRTAARSKNARDGQFRGYGDPSKLPLLLSKFRAFAEERAETHAPERKTH
jgi:hypothetical protein